MDPSVQMQEVGPLETPLVECKIGNAGIGEGCILLAFSPIVVFHHLFL